MYLKLNTAGVENLWSLQMKNNLTAIKIALPLILLSSQTQIASAADSVAVDSDGGLELSITANRRLQAVNETLAPVSVITRNDIEQLQAQDVIDVLRLQAGVDISRNGGAGSQAGVFLRGAESDQVLVLIDGMRVSSVTTGAFDWSSLPVDQIDRIEIVRGSRTALYGSDAIGGIIQVFTRKNAGPYASITAGKYGTRRGSAGFSKGFGKSKLSLNISAEKSDGFSASNEKAGAFVFNPDKDGHEKRSANIAFTHQLTDSTEAGLNAFYSNNKVDFDQGDSDADLQTINAYVQTKTSDKSEHKLSLSSTNNDLVSTSSFGVSKFETTRQVLNWQNERKLTANTGLILGVDYREDKGKTANFDDKITNKAVYANINNIRGAINLDFSGRYDKHSQAGSDFTGQIATGYSFSPATTAYASYGTAFRAPSINDLYSPGFFGSFAGNPDLKPESSKTFEVGIKSKLSSNHRLEANVFRAKIDDLISFTGDNNQAVNSENATLKGIELSYKGKMDSVNWGLGATFQRTEDDATGESLLRRPNNKFTANLGLALSARTHVGIDAIVSSSRDDNDFSSFPATRVSLPSYGLVNLSLKHKLRKHLDLGLRLENVTDEDYELAYGFNTPGRGAYFTISYK